MPSTCNHRPSPRPLPFCHFPLEEHIALVSRSSPECQVHASVGLSPVRCTPIAIEITVRYVPTAAGLPPATVEWVYTFPESFRLLRRRMCNSLFVDHLDVPWVNFVLGGIRMDLTFPLFPNKLLCQSWTLIPVGSFLGLGIFPKPWVGVSLGFSPNGLAFGLGIVPQSWVRMSLGFSPKGLTFGLGLVPQSVATSSLSSPGSLVSWL